MPLVPIWLFSKFKYFNPSQFWRAAPIFYAVASPKLLPCKLRLIKAGQFYKHFANIYNPTSDNSLNEKSTCLIILISDGLHFNIHRGSW
jgi:hypothetical protein